VCYWGKYAIIFLSSVLSIVCLLSEIVDEIVSRKITGFFTTCLHIFSVDNFDMQEFIMY